MTEPISPSVFDSWQREAARALDAKQRELKAARRALVWLARYGDGVRRPKYVRDALDAAGD